MQYNKIFFKKNVNDQFKKLGNTTEIYMLKNI